MCWSLLINLMQSCSIKLFLYKRTVLMTHLWTVLYNIHCWLSVPWAAYLSEVRVGVESALVAHRGVALGACIAVWLAVCGACQICGLAHRTELAAGHGCDLGQRIRWGGSAASGRDGVSTFAVPHVHLEVLPCSLTLTGSLRLRRCSGAGSCARWTPRFGSHAQVCLIRFALDTVGGKKRHRCVN